MGFDCDLMELSSDSMGFIVIQWDLIMIQSDFIVIQWDMNGIYPLVNYTKSN